MDTIEALADELAVYLSAYKHYIAIKSKGRLRNNAIFGEALCRDIAEIVFDYEDLANLNLLKSDHPAVDLASASKKHAIQVTISEHPKKIEQTLDMFIARRYDETYSRLIVIILGNKRKSYTGKNIIRSKGNFYFDPAADILDLDDLYDLLVKKGNADKFRAFSKRIEAELSAQIQPLLLDYKRPGQRVRDLLSAHDVTVTNAVQSLAKFGVTRKIYSDTASLSEVIEPKLVRYLAEQFAISREWIDAESDHVYCNGPDIEPYTDWRRSLRGAYDLVGRMFSHDEQPILIIPVERKLSDFEGERDVVDHREMGYDNFMLISCSRNDFSEKRYKLILSEPLSYRSTREGIFLLFLAAEIHDFLSQRTKYVDVLVAERTNLLACKEGERFAVDLVHSGHIIGNHKDYVYCHNGLLHATPDLPRGSQHRLQSELDNLISQNHMAFERLKELSWATSAGT